VFVSAKSTVFGIRSVGVHGRPSASSERSACRRV
jgi:hypothetical protein